MRRSATQAQQGRDAKSCAIPNVGEEALKPTSTTPGRGAYRRRGEAWRFILVGKILPKGEKPALRKRSCSAQSSAGKGRRCARQPRWKRLRRRRDRHRDQRSSFLAQSHGKGRAREGHRGSGAREALKRNHADEEIKIFAGLALPQDQAQCSAAVKPPPASWWTTRARQALEQGRRARRCRARRRGHRVSTGREIPIENGTEEVGLLLSDRGEEPLSGEREEHFHEKIDRLSRGDELPPGVIKMVKVYIRHQEEAPGRRQDGRSSRQQVVWLAAFCRKRTCRISKTALRSTSC